jgi:hypothetical protein
MLSVALDPELHRQFTNDWRELIPYGSKNITLEDIWRVAQEVYKEFPDLLEAARKTLFGG